MLSQLYNALPLMVGVKLVVFFFMRLYRGMWRYTSLPDIINIVKATTLAFFLTILLLTYSVRLQGFSRAGITCTALGLICFFSLSRLRGEKTTVGAKIFMACLLVLIMIYGVRIGFDTLIDRFLRLDDDTSRLLMWEDGITMLTGHPNGIGLGNTVHVSSP